MKRIYLFLMTITFTSLVKGINHETAPKQKQFSLCRRLKTINPCAPQQDYEELARSLLDADLSTCECVQHLIEEKKAKAFQYLLDDSFLTQESFETFERLMEKIKRQDQIVLKKLAVETPEGYPEIKKQEIIDHFSPNYDLEFKSYKKDRENPKSAGATTLVTYYPDPKHNTKENPSYLLSEKLSLYIPEGFHTKSALDRKAIFLHEEQHLISHHGFLRFLLEYEIENNRNNRDFPYNDYNKLKRAQELEADIIPAACDPLECAYALSNLDLSDHNNIFDSENPPTHPTADARNKWLKRIYKLRLHEEELFKKRSQSL